jgi:hypothetical protein
MEAIYLENMSALNIINVYFSVLVDIMDWFNMPADLLINYFIIKCKKGKVVPVLN